MSRHSEFVKFVIEQMAACHGCGPGLLQIARILEEAERDLSAYVTADGTAAFDTSAHIVTGKKR